MRCVFVCIVYYSRGAVERTVRRLWDGQSESVGGELWLAVVDREGDDVHGCDVHIVSNRFGLDVSVATAWALYLHCRAVKSVTVYRGHPCSPPPC